MKRTLAAAALAISGLARAEGPATEPPPTPSPPGPAAALGARPLPLGIVLSADLGGGGRLGGGSQYTPRGVFEAELSAGYEVAAGFRPELSFMLGVAPTTYAALRIGFRYVVPDTPFYARAALDGSTERGTARWRWLLGGAGGEVRLTDVLGGFAEADLGVPLTSGAGIPVLLRAGVTFRL